ARYVSFPHSRGSEAADDYPAGNESPAVAIADLQPYDLVLHPTDESEFHFRFSRQVAVTNCGAYSFFPSISAISSSVKERSAAPTFPSTCFALRAPTMAPVTAGFRNVQAIATCPGGRPWRSPTLRKRSTSARFFDSLGSWNSASRLLQSLDGRASARSRVIAPVNKPEAIGE